MGCFVIGFIVLALAIVNSLQTCNAKISNNRKNSMDWAWNPETHVNSHMKTLDKKSASFKRTTRLYSKASQDHVRIHTTGRVDGSGKETSEFARLSIESATFGKLSIRGVKTGLYLCMNKKGRLVGRKKRGRKEKRKKCMFEEIQSNGYFYYESSKYPKWYIAINGRGRALPGPVGNKRKKRKSRQFMQRHYEKPRGKYRKMGRARRMKKRRRLSRKSRKQSARLKSI